uniref:Uncharacterized protein n=1 Tax=Meloidogyne enterolobii TaxID=390850 RepID=A0A6V7UUF1_MELEN|nr:unnamed protein product [Meloidogyne enterolobii]
MSFTEGIPSKQSSGPVETYPFLTILSIFISLSCFSCPILINSLAIAAFSAIIA